MIAVLLLAAGSGARFGSETPKQYLQVDGKALLCHTLESLAAEKRITRVQPVIAKNDPYFSACIQHQDYPFQLLPPVLGGAERAMSMQRGLAALPADVDLVAIHDAARPVPSPALLADVLDMAIQHGAAIPGIAVHDTIKRINTEGRVLETPVRSSLMAVQTPQVIRRDWLMQALKQEEERLHLHTDDASVLEAAGFPVYVSRGDANNRKITTPDDMAWFTQYLQTRSL